MSDPNKNKRISRINIALSLLVAFGAWLYVVMEVSPTIGKTYSEIPILLEGTGTLADEGLGVESVSESDLKIKVRIERTEVIDTSEEDFTAIVDVSGASKGTNTYDVKVVTPSGSTLVEQSVESVTVKVSSSLNRDVPVSAVFGSLSDDQSEPIIVSADYETVSVIGAASEVTKVAYAAVQVDSITPKSDGAGDNYVRSTVGRPVAVDAEGRLVPNIVVRPETVDLRYSAGSTKTVPLDIEVEGESDEYTYDYELPNSIVIKGEAKKISSVTGISAILDLSTLTRSGEGKPEYRLPQGVSIANRSLAQSVTVKVGKK